MVEEDLSKIASTIKTSGRLIILHVVEQTITSAMSYMVFVSASGCFYNKKSKKQFLVEMLKHLVTIRSIDLFFVDHPSK